MSILPRYSYPGSLPRALTLSERERVLRVLQPTATFEMLNRIPAERLSPDDSSTEPRTSKPDVGRSKRLEGYENSSVYMTVRVVSRS